MSLLETRVKVEFARAKGKLARKYDDVKERSALLIESIENLVRKCGHETLKFSQIEEDLTAKQLSVIHSEVSQFLEAAMISLDTTSAFFTAEDNSSDEAATNGIGVSNCHHLVANNETFLESRARSSQPSSLSSTSHISCSFAANDLNISNEKTKTKNELEPSDVTELRVLNDSLIYNNGDHLNTSGREGEVNSRLRNHAENDADQVNEAQAFPLPPVVPQPEINCGANGFVGVSYAKSLKEFWVQPDMKASLEFIWELQAAQAELIKSGPSKLNSFTAGTLCTAKFKVDQLWYRAKIVHFYAKKQEAHVYYVDYGNDERIPISWIMPLAEKLRNRVAQCIKCTLAGFDIRSCPIKVDLAVERFKNVTASAECCHAIFFNTMKENNRIENCKLHNVQLSVGKEKTNIFKAIYRDAFIDL